MAFQAVPDTASVTMLFVGEGGTDLAGCEAQFTMYVRNEAAAWEAATLAQLAQYHADWFTTGHGASGAFKTAVNAAWRCTEVVARDLTVSGGLTSSVAVNAVGTGSGDPVPPSCPLWVKFVGASGQLPKDGGVFLPVGAESGIDGTRFDAGFVAAVEGMVEDWRTDLNDPLGGGVVAWAHVIVSRAQSTNDDVKDARAALKAAIAATRRPEAVTNLVQDVVGRQVIGSQRDRRAL